MNSRRIDRIEVRPMPSFHVTDTSSVDNRTIPVYPVTGVNFYVLDVYRDGTERIYHSIGGSFDHCWFAARELAEVLDCCAYAVDVEGNAYKSYGEGGHE